MERDVHRKTVMQDTRETPPDPLVPVRAEIGTLAIQLSVSGKVIDAYVSSIVRQRDDLKRIAEDAIEFITAPPDASDGLKAGIDGIKRHLTARLRSAAEEAQR